MELPDFDLPHVPDTGGSHVSKAKRYEIAVLTEAYLEAQTRALALDAADVPTDSDAILIHYISKHVAAVEMAECAGALRRAMWSHMKFGKWC